MLAVAIAVDDALLNSSAGFNGEGNGDTSMLG